MLVKEFSVQISANTLLVDGLGQWIGKQVKVLIETEEENNQNYNLNNLRGKLSDYANADLRVKENQAWQSYVDENDSI